MKITIPAAHVKQGALSLYTCSLPVRTLMQKGFYDIERLDSGDRQKGGYQRVLQESRAKRLADYIVNGQETKDAFLPTSVFLATDKEIPFNDTNNTIYFDTDEIEAFSVVDGQHRLEGLRIAAEKDSRVLDFEIPVNIAYNLPRLAQMCHFLIVNTTQKSVDPGIEQQIISRLTDSVDVEEIPTLPKWIKNIVEKGDTQKALKMVEFLNNTPESPWKGKIQMANQPKEKGMTIKQHNFVKTVNNFVMTASHPLRAIGDQEKERKIYLNYWKAISNLLSPDDGSETVLYKSIGVTLFSMFSIPFFHKLNVEKNYTEENMEHHFKKCFNNIIGEYEGVGSVDWWLSGSGQAGKYNSGELRKISGVMAQALNTSDGDGDIKI